MDDLDYGFKPKKPERDIYQTVTKWLLRIYFALAAALVLFVLYDINRSY